MSNEIEQVEASDPNPSSVDANTDDTDETEGSPGGSQRASPVSSEESAAGRPSATTMDPNVESEPVHVNATAQPNLSHLKGKEESKDSSDSPNARAFRSVSHDNAETSEVDDGSGEAEQALLQLSYQSLEAKLHSIQQVPSRTESARSETRHETDVDEPTTQSVELQVTDSDGPPRFITTKPAGTGKRAGKMRRRGKWTVEEEAYVARVIQDFNSGFLDAPAGTTLRTFLSDKLNCDPMRITKKFTGEACIGKRVFHPAIRSPSNAAAIDKAQVSPKLDMRRDSFCLVEHTQA